MTFRFKKVKLNLACGLDYKSGWFNIDNKSMFPDCRLDINKDIFDLEYPPNSVDEILLSHFVMYTRPNELRVLLKTWHKWLKPNGKITIETSDLSKLCSIYSSESSELIKTNHALYNMFGKPEDSPHRWGWDVATLVDILRKAGFTEITLKKGKKKAERDISISAKCIKS